MPLALSEIVEGFRKQAEFCAVLDAPFTTGLIAASARAIEENATVASLFRNWSLDPLTSALPLRFIGAMQWLSLEGKSEELVSLYKSFENVRSEDELAPIIRRAVETHYKIFEKFLEGPPQTNEPRRAAALLPGFSFIARECGLPLDLYEIGSSAGLLLAFDKYSFRYGDTRWGDSDVVIDVEWRGTTAPDLEPAIRVEGRRGCDLNPIGLDDPAALRRVDSYIWPDQNDRKARFRACAKEAAQAGVIVEKASAGEWAGNVLAARREGAVAVLFHSVMNQYLDEETKKAVGAALSQAGDAATEKSPVAWLRFEPVPEEGYPFYTELTIWPGGAKRRLCQSHPHGAWVSPVAL